MFSKNIFRKNKIFTYVPWETQMTLCNPLREILRRNDKNTKTDWLLQHMLFKGQPGTGKKKPFLKPKFSEIALHRAWSAGNKTVHIWLI